MCKVNNKDDDVDKYKCERPAGLKKMISIVDVSDVRINDTKY